MKTLMVKCLAETDNDYNPIIVFKKVDYLDKGKNYIVSENKKYYLNQFDKNTQVILRCQCEDFKWRFKYYDHVDKSLFGHKGVKYEAKGIAPPANPLQKPGICKHLMAMSRKLNEMNLLI